VSCQSPGMDLPNQSGSQPNRFPASDHNILWFGNETDSPFCCRRRGSAPRRVLSVEGADLSPTRSARARRAARPRRSSAGPSSVRQARAPQAANHAAGRGRSTPRARATCRARARRTAPRAGGRRLPSRARRASQRCSRDIEAARRAWMGVRMASRRTAGTTLYLISTWVRGTMPCRPSLCQPAAHARQPLHNFRARR
jgi:hypothetical protein